MASVLVVRAHPLRSEKSGSMRLTDAFVSAYREAHPDDKVTELWLYDVAIPEIDIDLLNGWEKLTRGEPFSHLHLNEQNKITLFDNYTQQFLDSDKIVLANPLWNLQVPTRLKAWIDTICVAGKTFRYNEQGEPEALASGKQVLHIQTSGGVFGGNDPASQYVSGMMYFLGAAKVHTVIAEGMDHEPDRADEIMRAAQGKLVALAPEF